jgi:hypothetical protein
MLISGDWSLTRWSNEQPTRVEHTGGHRRVVATEPPNYSFAVEATIADLGSSGGIGRDPTLRSYVNLGGSARSIQHLCRLQQHRVRNPEPHRSGNSPADDDVVLGGFLDGYLGRLRAAQYLVNLPARRRAQLGEVGAL